jgi:hypothetical protein
MKIRLVVTALAGAIAGVTLSPVVAQAADDNAPATPVVVQMPDGTYRQGYAVPAQAAVPEPEPKQFALTANPLNFTIGRYGLNFEYQPTLHHGVIVSPHYDHVSADIDGSTIDENGNLVSARWNNSFSGFGAEIGYRFYSGSKGFNGFFAGPSLLLATYSSSGDLLGNNVSTSFTSIGWAWEVGGQAQLGGGFIIGGGGGMQYTKVSKDMGDLPFSAAVIAGGGWRPRVLLNIGYAF